MKRTGWDQSRHKNKIRSQVKVEGLLYGVRSNAYNDTSRRDRIDFSCFL